MTPPHRRVLFICTGNTCRSPMAEHLFRKLLSDAGLTEIEVRSAGTAPARMGFPDEASSALRREGISAVRHSPSGLDETVVAWADLILTMERRHRDALIERFPQAAGKTRVLKEFAGTAEGREGIADPFGGDESEYRTALSEIKDALAAIIRQWSPERR